MKFPSDPAKGLQPNVTRRRLLIDTAKAIAAAAALMPPNVQGALAQEKSRKGSFRDIKHVVMLKQENRSFDHYFGTRAGVRGFDDPNALKSRSHILARKYLPRDSAFRNFLVVFAGEVEVAVYVAGAETKMQNLLVRIVNNRREHLGIDGEPVHISRPVSFPIRSCQHAAAGAAQHQRPPQLREIRSQFTP